MTKGAGTITLEGDGDGPAKTGLNATSPFKHTDTFPVNPKVTTTYTLKASKGTDTATAQFTVTAGNQITRMISREIVVDKDQLRTAAANNQSFVTQHNDVPGLPLGLVKVHLNSFGIDTGLTWGENETLLGHWFVPIAGFADLANFNFCFTFQREPPIDMPRERKLWLVLHVDPPPTGHGTVSGRVSPTDEGGLGFFVPSVSLFPGGRTVSTDQGRFNFGDLPSGRDFILLFVNGLSLAQSSVRLAPDESLSIDLLLDQNQLDIELTQSDVFDVAPFSVRLMVHALVSAKG